MGSYRSTILAVFSIFLLQIFLLFADSSQEVTILFTGEEKGRLEPCGCATHQLGGLPRRHFFIEHLLESEKPDLLVSNGDLVNGTSRQDELKFETTLQAMNVMGYQVLNLGEKELQLGRDYLKSIEPLAKFHFLASNVRDSEGQPFFETIFSGEADFGERSVAIKVLGILSIEFQKDLDPSIRVLDPKEVLRQALSETSPLSGGDEDSQSQIFWIVLYHGDFAEALEIAKSFPQIRLIIAGHDVEEPSGEPVKVGETVIASNSISGKYAGQVRFGLDQSGPASTRPSSESGEAGRLSFKELEFKALDESVGSSEVVERLLGDYQSSLESEKIFASSEGRMTSERGVFVGSQTCKGCHIEAFKVWQGSRHPHAYEDIVKAKRQFDPDCLVCHSTGFRYNSGFAGIEKTPRLTEVGCEACHGAGSLHIRGPKSNPMLRPGVGTCLGCHDSENSPHFDFEKYWGRIRH